MDIGMSEGLGSKECLGQTKVESTAEAALLRVSALGRENMCGKRRQIPIFGTLVVVL